MLSRFFIFPLALLLCSSITPLVAAADSGFYAGARIGVSEVDFARTYRDLHIDEEGSLLGLVGNIGYQSQMGLLIEGSGSYAEDLGALGSTFDNTELGSFRVAVGWAIPIGEKVLIIPKAGQHHWRLVLEEGQFFNAGSEDKLIFENTEGFYELEARLRPLDFMAISFSLFNANTQFGLVRALNVGVQFNW